jgi:hypothetical protein
MSLTARQPMYFGQTGQRLKTRPATNLGLESDWSDSLRSTVGLFLWESDYTLQQNTGILNNINPIASSSHQLLRFASCISQEVESTAVFGQVDWDVTDRLMLECRRSLDG